MALHATIFTLFPQMFPGALGHSLSGKALTCGVWRCDAVNLHEFSDRSDGRVDDRPYGGGAGMVIRAEVIDRALTEHCGSPETVSAPLIYFTPRGSLLTQETVEQLAGEPRVFLLAGRYEGIDQRVIDKWRMREICVGPYVLSGGELPAQILLDAMVRTLPDVIGNPESLREESFSPEFAHEYPHYTRPQDWQGRAVPEVLLSGDHQAIAKWHSAHARKLEP